MAAGDRYQWYLNRCFNSALPILPNHIRLEEADNRLEGMMNNDVPRVRGNGLNWTFLRSFNDGEALPCPAFQTAKIDSVNRLNESCLTDLFFL